jgi:hypothetical protein
MREADFDAFGQMLDQVCGLLSRGAHQPNAANTAMWFRSLARFDLAAVRSAFDAHVSDPQRGRFIPVPADIIAQIEQRSANDGRPGPEEAWALALGARDEAATVVWTPEVAQAWNIAKTVFDVGDEVGARMAFKEAYTRLVDEARRERKRCEWTASLGFNAAARHDAIEQAVQLGRLPQEDLLALPAPATSTVGQEWLTALLGVRDRIAGVREGPSEADLEREETARQKARADALVREYAAQQASGEKAA